MIETTLLVPFAIAVFLGANMGASGLAPAFAAPFAARLVSRGLMVALFGLFVLVGAVLSGGKVLRTIGGDIVPQEAMAAPVVSIVLAATACSMLLANLLHVPQSTSQSTVFALMGSAMALDVFRPATVFVGIVPAWFLLPTIAFILTFVASRYVFLPAIRRGLIDSERISAHGAWRWVTVALACYVAYALGSNNVANIAGPLVSLVQNRAAASPADAALVAFLVTMVVSPWFGIGAAMLGRGPVDTAGRAITQLGPMAAAFSALVTATLLLLASVTRGIPTSLVQLNAATIIAIALAREGGLRTILQTSVPRLLTLWIVAPLVAFLLAYGLTRAWTALA